MQNQTLITYKIILSFSLFLMVGCTTSQTIETQIPSTQEALIQVAFPKAGSTIQTPLIITGQARGFWFFEATAPVFLFDEAGNRIGQSFIQATEPWMTEDFISFEGTIDFEHPPALQGQKGLLQLNRQNASGLPENDATVEIPILFK